MASILRPFLRSPAGFLVLTALAPLSSLAAGNVNHGRKLFIQSCGLCHATGHDAHPPAGQGPLLAGVVGRKAGSVPNFGYTDALKKSGLTWDPATLDSFLSAPTKLVPGTNMVVPIADDSDRADVIAFLATLKPVTLNSAPALGEHARTAGDYQNDAPGAHHEVNLAELPAPYATTSAGNSPKTLPQPEGAHLSVPQGFQVKLFFSKLHGPRLLRVAPNGDIFIAETGAGNVRILRAADGADSPSEDSLFATDLDRPFGIAFYPLGDSPEWVYIAENNRVIRYPYKNGDLKARGDYEVVVPKLAETTGGHTSRDVAFSADSQKLFISIGSSGNVADGISTKTASEVKEWEAQHGFGAAWDFETNRAAVFTCDPKGGNFHAYATGIRNAVTLAVQPSNGSLWVSTNERDELGDDLVPDYISHIEEGHFYGWPWWYMGNHEDPRRKGERPDLAGKVSVPDVPVQSHSATLQMLFYPEGASGVSAFPAEYRGDIFAAFHGSWNRTGRTGSKVVRVHLKDGKPVGGYEDFLTGFVIDDGHVWGRPVGVAVAHDGALLVTDDAASTLWRVSTVRP